MQVDETDEIMPEDENYKESSKPLLKSHAVLNLQQHNLNVPKTGDSNNKRTTADTAKKTQTNDSQQRTNFNTSMQNIPRGLINTAFSLSSVAS